MTIVVYACNAKDQAKMIFELGKKSILMSYYYLNQKRSLVDLLEFIYPNIEMFILDSGAYSAWRSGKVINLYQYIDFIKKYHKYFTHIVCLDVIDNPVYSEVNHLIMIEELKEYNLTIMPVFHAGEPFSVLDYMIKKGYKYIGISPNNNWFEKAKRSWLDKVFSRYDFEALGIKTHGFGYQSLDGVNLYPLSSTDAATWNLASGYGRIMDVQNPSVRYSERAIGESDHIDGVMGGDSPFTLEICSDLGLTTDQLKSDYVSRRKFNIEATDRALSFKKGIRSVEVDLFSDVDSSFGYLSQDFSEDLVLEVLEKVLSTKEYIGSPV